MSHLHSVSSTTSRTLSTANKLHISEGLETLSAATRLPLLVHVRFELQVLRRQYILHIPMLYTWCQARYKLSPAAVRPTSKSENNVAHGRVVHDTKIGQRGEHPRRSTTTLWRRSSQLSVQRSIHLGTSYRRCVHHPVHTCHTGHTCQKKKRTGGSYSRHHTNISIRMNRPITTIGIGFTLLSPIKFSLMEVLNQPNTVGSDAHQSHETDNYLLHAYVAKSILYWA